ncbi:protein ACTIVITY OF BC1 COMPLEX KINASE 8, chloroplastic isoform X1 [Elaeis guineensis]|uniref:Protein ACTIVITY OF BC1 COMPLEX KINASE 8, chloroplastic n=1 Tax=Elaeis guineensis var. tenera TaxID=51953 RepID=A0A6I9S3B2_ELAGV|nr:protein ACTIVITY OF BC1 COMPLEX KINASE 8, chloroplastic [Elaeis guineensis]XP_010937034.1 protein ACTIVITY OF BC1 COMPLEX KINASE 8, chloroplastic [Elaeis guineensis]
MAVFLATSPPAVRELLFFRPESGRRLHVPLLRYQFQSRRRRRLAPSWIVLRSVSEERVAVTEVSAEEKGEISVDKELDGSSWNGNGGGFGYEVVSTSTNGSLDAYLEGNGAGNGSLVKYTGGNGTIGEVVDDVSEERKRKKRVEDIGKEEAWFKKAGQEPQVSVAPGGRWNRFKTYSTIQRTLEIWGFVFTFLFRAWLNNQKFAYRGGMTEEKKVIRRKALAKWLKESILRLGPTFIKIGQQFSTRVDILAQEYVEQLSELQDQVPPFPSETSVSIIEEELGASLDDIFDRFDYEPIAAASLGQVHRASLKGQEVVIKVQRPGLKELFDIDLKNLRVIAEYLQKVDPKSDGAKRDWVAIYDECASVLYQEIDYTREAANAEKFAENFKDMDYVKVPNVYWEYTTPQVLTMEYVPGIKINRIKQLDQLGVDRQRLGRYAVESYLEQILSHGFFHADPHPGNIAVDDVNGGRLIFYDFGMMGSISSNIREGLLEAFYGIYEKDPEKVLQAMIQMGVLVPTGDMTAVRRTAQFFLNSFEERLAAQRKEREMATTELGFKKPLSREERLEKKKQRLAAIGEDLLAIAADQPFRFPATFTFVVRAFSVLDGIGKGLDPRFDITEIAKPYALELLRFREAGFEVVVKDVKKRLERQSRAFYNLFRQADRVEKLAEIIERLEKGDLKLRVRTLESERAFQRVAAVQKTIGNAVVAGSLINLATILYLNSIRVPAMTAYMLCAFFGMQVLFGILKVKRLDQQERLITGTA